MNVYGIYDMAAGAYLAPFYQPNDATAIRVFRGSVNDGQSMFWQSPQDFTLHGLGEFDEESGLFTQDKGPRPIISAMTLVERDGDPRQVPMFDKDKALENLQRDIGHTDGGEA